MVKASNRGIREKKCPSYSPKIGTCVDVSASPCMSEVVRHIPQVKVLATRGSRSGPEVETSLAGSLGTYRPYQQTTASTVMIALEADIDQDNPKRSEHFCSVECPERAGEETVGSAAASTMLRIECSGTPFEIGHTHGIQAKLQISRSIAFYTDLFQRSTKLAWPEVCVHALRFRPFLQAKFPQYLDEIAGIAAGCGRSEADILAINVRTEITFGMFSDGCTALSWRTPRASWLAQNWDWEPAQQENLVLLSIVAADGRPRVKMVTEAGLIGKIGFNDAGVGVCLNAIRQHGADPERLPCHVGLRLVLDSRSCGEAVARLEAHGVATSCHMLVADATGGIGLEWTSTRLAKLEMSPGGQVLHTNHFINRPAGGPTADGGDWLGDSEIRLKRIRELVAALPIPAEDSVNKQQISGLFEDEENYPGAICRRQIDGKTDSQTLFNIVMDLTAKTATVRVGRPTEAEETIELSFGYL